MDWACVSAMHVLDLVSVSRGAVLVGRIFPWVVCIAVVAFAILIGICGGQTAVECDDLREDNKALRRDTAELRLEIDALKISARSSYSLKRLELNILRTRCTAYEAIYGMNEYSYGQIPE